MIFLEWLRPLLSKQDYEVYKALMGLHRPRRTVEELKLAPEQIQASQARIAFYGVLYQFELHRQGDGERDLATIIRMVQALKALDLSCGDVEQGSDNDADCEAQAEGQESPHIGMN